MAFDAANERAYVSVRKSKSIAVLDVSTRSSPTYVGSLVDSSNLDYAHGISYEASSGYVYVTSATSNRLVVADVQTDPSVPTLVSSFDFSGIDSPNIPNDILLLKESSLAIVTLHCACNY